MSVLVALQGGVASTDFTGSWTQAAASWSATLAETDTSTASWTQAAASWSATAAETLTSTASFVQAAATWAATDAEVIDSTGAWVQAAATWHALAASADNSFTGAWTQTAATWDATADTPLPTGGTGGKFGPRVIQRRAGREPEPIPEPVAMYAAFVQPPASWRAEMDTFDPYALFLLTDEPALIGAR
jgi:hypothetical protein